MTAQRNTGPRTLAVRAGEAMPRHRVEDVAVAVPGLTPRRFRQAAEAAETGGASVRHLPSYVAAPRRDVIGARRLTDRPEIPVTGPDAGAGGWTGSEPLDHDASPAHRLEREPGDFARTGRSGPGPRHILRFPYDRATLPDDGPVRPVAGLRPLAVLP